MINTLRSLLFTGMNLIAISYFCGIAVSCAGKSSEVTAGGKGDGSAVVFVYHRFGDDRFPSTNISTDNFRSHLRFLRDNNYTVMTLSDAVADLKKGNADKKIAVITVDDGYKSFLSGAMPLLKEFEMPATLFVNTETVGSADYLGWKELHEIASSGIEIGNHSHSHAYFLNYPEQKRADAFKKDMARAQQLLTDKLGDAPRVIAYPYGEYSSEMKEVAESMGFEAAAAQNSGVMHSGADFYAIPRFPMSDSYASGFAEKAGMQPLRVSKAQPESVLVGEENPPVLEITFEEDSLRLEAIQCFVQYGECQVGQLQQNPLKVRVKAKGPLRNRRTLYTITVPSAVTGKWHWYSHLWVRPEIEGKD